MARNYVSVRVTIPEKSKRIVEREIFKKFAIDTLKRATTQILDSLYEVIKTYMTHTTKRGYIYRYTGGLASSFRSKTRPNVIDRPKEIIIRNVISSRHPAAGILQTGGKIRPKNASRLTVPLSDASKFGISLHEAQLLKESGKLFLRNGKLYLKIGGRSIPLFVLKTVVKIPRYRYITKALRKAGFKFK